MTIRTFALAAIAAGALVPAAGTAATIDLDVTLDITQPKFVPGPGFQGWQGDPAFSPAYSVELAEGDIFDLTIDFAGSQSLTLTNTNLLWAFSYSSGDSTDVTGTGTLSLLDADGNAFAVSDQMTSTEGEVHFGQSFTDAQFGGLLTGPVTFYGVRYLGLLEDYVDPAITSRIYDTPGFYYSADAVNAVPEPATWAMMLGGFGLVGAATRRRSRMTVRFA